MLGILGSFLVNGGNGIERGPSPVPPGSPRSLSGGDGIGGIEGIFGSFLVNGGNGMESGPSPVPPGSPKSLSGIGGMGGIAGIFGSFFVNGGNGMVRSDGGKEQPITTT